MQNKGFVRLLAAALMLVCLFYLSFSFVTNSYSRKADEYAKGDNEKYYNFMDSVAGEKVWLGYTLRECREKEIKTGVISNGAWDHQWQKVRRLGLLRWIPKERIFISGEVGAAKPEPEIFRAVENRLGLGPEALCLAGDSYPNDIFGAKRAGWKAIWLNRRGHRKPKGMPEPDFQVKNEEELFEKVKEISGKGARAECMIS